MNTCETFQAFWHGRPLPLLQWACLKSFIDRGHQVNLYTYEDIDVPRGVTQLSAGKIIPESEIFFFDNATNNIASDIAPFADFFRLKLLFEKGGWYIDCDVICNTYNYPFCEYAWAHENPSSDPGFIGNSQLKFPAGSDLVHSLYDECIKQKYSFTSREELGPKLISRILTHYPKPSLHLGSADSFYPLKWIETFKLWLPSFRQEVESKCNNALFISCFASLFSYMQLPGDRLPPKGSFLMDFYESQCPERLNGYTLSEDEILVFVKKFLHENEWAIHELYNLSDVETLNKIGL